MVQLDIHQGWFQFVDYLFEELATSLKYTHSVIYFTLNGTLISENKNHAELKKTLNWRLRPKTL